MSLTRLINAALFVLVCLPQAVLALTPLPSEAYLTGKFRDADLNGDGRLSRPEYLRMWTYDRKLGQQQFLKLDKDRDGFLTLEEYLAPVRERRPPGKPRN